MRSETAKKSQKEKTKDKVNRQVASNSAEDIS